MTKKNKPWLSLAKDLDYLGEPKAMDYAKELYKIGWRKNIRDNPVVVQHLIQRPSNLAPLAQQQFTQMPSANTFPIPQTHRWMD